jgi:hypothetical protein
MEPLERVIALDGRQPGRSPVWKISAQGNNSVAKEIRIQ